MNVNNINSLYQEFQNEWQLVRDSVAGEGAIKARDNAQSQTYLIRSSGHDDNQYYSYKARAHFTNFTGRTLEGIYGQIFSKLPERIGEIPERFQALLDNADLTGNSIDQFSSDLVYDVLQTGWGGILVDHAPVEEGMSVSDQEKANLTSFMRWYKAEDVINWRYDIINNQKVLALVVLQENYNAISDKDEFVTVPRTRYRVLKLVNGLYVQEVYEENPDKNAVEKFVISETFNPKLNGQPLNFIPFYTCPAREPEKSMLLPVAYVNLAHYQTSADYTNYTHYAGTLTAYAAGIKVPMKRDAKGNITNEPDDIYLGLDAMLMLEANGTESPRLGYLEPTGQGGAVLIRAIENLKQDIEKMGGDLIATRKKGVETAEAARIHQAGENAVMGSFSLNMSEKLTEAIRLCALWRGVPQDITDQFSYVLNTDYEYDDSNIDNRNMGLREVEAGVKSKKSYMIEDRGMDEKSALEELALIEGDKPDYSGLDFNLENTEE